MTDSTLPDITNWANLTIEERQLLVKADRDKRPVDDKEAQAWFSLRFNACEAIIKPYVESLGQFKVIKAHKHAMRDYKDKWAHDQIVSSIVHAMLGRLWIYEATVAQHLIDQHKAGEMIELIGCEVLRCYSCGKHSHIVEMKGNTLKPLQYDETKPFPCFDHVELEDCPIDAKLPYSAEIDIPSGKMVMANHLSPLFKEVDEKYSEEMSINYVWGRKNTTLAYAKQGYIEMNIGNCSCRMYKMNNTSSKFVVGESDCVKGRKEVANVCTDFWGYGIADLDLAMKNGLEKMQKDRPHMSFDVIPCKPGRYRFTHRYHLCRDSKREIFTHIEWIES
jgi:hypothetical protein